MIACPFRIPRYEYELAFPVVRKCQLCRHRIAEGKYAACCEFCPTGASIYGRVEDLRSRPRASPSRPAPSGVPGPDGAGARLLRSKVARYVDHVYGLTEVGGTQVLLLAGVPFASSASTTGPRRPRPAYTIQEGLYRGFEDPGPHRGVRGLGGTAANEPEAGKEDQP